jgi:alkylhydroperoxidase/carboxymuconolactone decarboxylase family protein YurZ
MDEKTKILVCVGAAVAANCVPCFRQYNGKAAAAGIDPADVQEAVMLASQVKTGAHAALMGAIESATGTSAGANTEMPSCCGGGSTSTACGS